MAQLNAGTSSANPPPPSNGTNDAAAFPLTIKPTLAPSATLATDPLPTVHVNKANLSEIKSALDDIVRKHMSDQAFQPSHLHPTVHLSLGYASVILALGSVVYCLRLSFEDAKPILWVAVVGYSVLQALLWAWKRWVERGEVFRGRRRRVVKRIETDLIQIYTSTSLTGPPAPVCSVSPNSRPGSPISATSPVLLPSAPSSAPSSPSSGASSPPRSQLVTPSSADPQGPSYVVHLTLSTTSNNGKSLIHKARVISGKPVGGFVDEDGGVEEGEVARWIASLLGNAGLVEVDEEGFKEE